ncbi:MAG: MarR family transcriptional regulator [Pediococcus sp.]|nr:MarR family transcriptional regulator [Pediococcus sp.]
MAKRELDSYLRAINTVSHKVSQYMNNELKDLGLTSSTYFFVLKVGDMGELSQEELFKQIYLNPSNVTRRLNRLIKLGYISKEKSPVDGRTRIIKLTPLGTQKYDQLVRCLPTINQAVVETLDPKEAVVLKQLVGKMETGLDALLD